MVAVQVKVICNLRSIRPMGVLVPEVSTVGAGEEGCSNWGKEVVKEREAKREGV